MTVVLWLKKCMYVCMGHLCRAVWCWALTRDPATGGVVHRIHYMMVPLLTLLTILLYVCSKAAIFDMDFIDIFPMYCMYVCGNSWYCCRSSVWRCCSRASATITYLCSESASCGASCTTSSPFWKVCIGFDRWLTSLHVHRTVGVMLFTVILLIGSGWSLMKSYLNDKEKKTILFVLVFTYFKLIVWGGSVVSSGRCFR